MQIESDISRAERLLGHDAIKLLNAKLWPVVISRALNKTLAARRKVVVREIRKHVRIPASKFKDHIYMYRAKKHRRTARFYLAERRGFSFAEFTPKTTPLGVTVFMFPKEGRHLITPFTDKGREHPIAQTQKNRAYATWQYNGGVWARYKSGSINRLRYADFLASIAQRRVVERLSAGTEMVFWEELQKVATQVVGRLW